MGAREAVDQDISPERSAFRLYLRTGRRVAFAAEGHETKFNPNHDPHNGRFTSGRGVRGGDLRGAASERRRPMMITSCSSCLLAPLTYCGRNHPDAPKHK